MGVTKKARTIEGIDVAGRTVAVTADIPRSVSDRGAASVTLYVDDEATSEQEEVLLNAWTGKLGHHNCLFCSELTKLNKLYRLASGVCILRKDDSGAPKV